MGSLVGISNVNQQLFSITNQYFTISRLQSVIINNYC